MDKTNARRYEYIRILKLRIGQLGDRMSGRETTLCHHGLSTIDFYSNSSSGNSTERILLSVYRHRSQIMCNQLRLALISATKMERLLHGKRTKKSCVIVVTVVVVGTLVL